MLLLLNKIDLKDQATLEVEVLKWQERLPKAEVIPISALNRFNLDYLMVRILELIPEGPAYFEVGRWAKLPRELSCGYVSRAM